MMVGSWDDQYFTFVILKTIVKAENVLPHLSKQSFFFAEGKVKDFSGYSQMESEKKYDCDRIEEE